MINSQTFISDTVLFLRNYLRSNITDPLARSEGFILTAYPKREVQYPIITIKNTGIDSRKLGMSSEISYVRFKAEVRVWSRNAKECDELTQKTINVLREAQYGSGSTTDNEIHGFNLLSTVPVVETDGDNTIHSKVCEFDYKVILT